MNDLTALPKFDAFIGGKKVAPDSGEYFETHDPYAGKAWARVARCGEEDVNQAVDAAWKTVTKSQWADMTPSGRGALLRKLGDLIAENAKELSRWRCATTESY